MIESFRLQLSAAAILTVLGGWVAWEFHAGTNLNAKVLPLRERSIEFARLGKENTRLKADIARLRELRRSQGEEINALSLQRAGAEGGTRPGFKPAREWRNSGNSTPADAYETYVWAMDHGDLRALAGVLSLDAASQAKMAEVFAKLSADAQAEYESPETLSALLFANQNPVWFTAMNVASQSQDQASVSKLTVDLQYPAGQVREHSFYFAQSGDSWKRYVSDAEVDYMLQSQLGISSTDPK
jgi:hypothetical protein